MPLLSSIGGGSAYAYRGNYDDWPDPFSFEDKTNLFPGTLATTSATITGINYKSVVKGTNNILISIDGGPFISSPQLIRNGQTVTLRYQTENSQSDSDFNKSFSTLISIGKRTASWLVTTKIKDNTPTAFTFNPVTQASLSTIFESNIVSIGNLENDYPTFAFISSGTATFSINGGSYLREGFVRNGDTVRLRQTSSPTYNTPVRSEITVGDYTTPFIITTREVDQSPDPFSFNSVSNANINIEQTSNTIAISGVDSDVPLTASISSPGTIRVNSSPNFVSGPINVFNGDTVTVRIPASAIVEYSKTYTATLNVQGVLGSFQVTTRPRPILTIPNPFSFTTISNSTFRTQTESNIITLSGMTEGDFGTATISGTGGDGTAAQFKVIRSSTVVRDYSSASFQVRNGDQIQLRMVSGGESSTVQATFTVSGTDTTTNLSGVPGSRSATWTVTSRTLTCLASSFVSSFTDVSTDIPNETKSTFFTISGLSDGCDNIVTTSDGNSYLRVNGSQGSSLSVKNGDRVDVYMTSPAGGTTRTTTITVRRPSGVDARSATWSITTNPPPPVPVVNISLSPTNIFEGETATLTWNTLSATSVVSSNFNATSLSGSITVRPTVTTPYTLTVSGPGGQVTGTATLTVGIKPPTVSMSVFPSSIFSGDSSTLSWSTQNATSIISSNFGAVSLQGQVSVKPTSSETYTLIVSGPGGQATGNATLTVNQRQPTVTLTASPTSVANRGSTTLTWSSTNATSVSSSNFGASSVNGSTTLYNLTSSQSYSITVSGPGGQATASVNVSVAACTPVTSSTSLARFKQGVIVYGNGFRQEGLNLFRSSTSSAYNLKLPNKPSFSYGQVQDSIASFYSGTLGRPVEDGGLVGWTNEFNSRTDLRTLSDLNSQILATYNADPPLGSGEATIVRTRGGRSRIEDSCGNIWTP